MQFAFILYRVFTFQIINYVIQVITSRNFKIVCLYCFKLSRVLHLSINAITRSYNFALIVLQHYDFIKIKI